MSRYCLWILRFTFFVVLTSLTSLTVFSQNTTFLALTSETTDIQTGQEYVVSIRLIDSPDVWVVSAGIEYDPSTVYVMGTVAGSPIRSGDFFSQAGANSIIRNFIKGTNTVEFTISMLGDVQPPSGSGVVGTFRIYPLKAGATSIQFKTAEITAITRTENGEIETSNIEFVPTKLDLNITGESVDPPDEATATPPPTATVSTFQGTNPDVEPTLANATLDPALLSIPTSEPIIDDQADSKQQDSNLILMALGLVIVGAIGITILGIFWARQNR